MTKSFKPTSTSVLGCDSLVSDNLKQAEPMGTGNHEIFCISLVLFDGNETRITF